MVVAVVHFHIHIPKWAVGRRAVNLVEVVREVGHRDFKNGNLTYLRHLSLHHRTRVVNDARHLCGLEVLNLGRGKRQARN